MIKVSIDGVFAPQLEQGLPRDSLDSLTAELDAAHKELMARRGGDIGFYDLPLNEDVVRAINSEVTRLRSLADDLIVLGVGGSSLGGQALVSALTPNLGKRCVHFVDNVDPDSLAVLLESLNPERAAAVVMTKSGGTVETLAQFLIVRRWFRSSVGQGETRSRMTFVTDPQKGLLRDLSQSEGIRAFEIPENVGGRFSVLSPVGLLPAAFAGIDIGELLGGARAMLSRVTDEDVTNNPACILAAGSLLAARHLQASSIVLMPYSDALRTTTSWFVQLWAESLGKRVDRAGNTVRAGQTPIAAIGACDQHAQVQLFVEGPRDKVITLIAVEKARHALPIPDDLADRDEVAFLHGRDLGELLSAERRATRAALLDACVPVLDIVLPTIDAPTVGGLLLLLESACALTGTVMGIDPFDQPGVEAGKRMALGLLGKSGYIEDAERVYRREEIGINR